jgi:hypothetical protein
MNDPKLLKSTNESSQRQSISGLRSINVVLDHFSLRRGDRSWEQTGSERRAVKVKKIGPTGHRCNAKLSNETPDEPASYLMAKALSHSCLRDAVVVVIQSAALAGQHLW